MATTIINARTHYDAAEAAHLANAALAIYDPPPLFETFAIGGWGARARVYFFTVESTQCAVIAGDDEIVVCFRGTESRLEDWIVDLDFSLVPGPLRGRVHEGFYEGLSLIWSSLDEQVRLLQGERPRRLIVAGHSLGGALATLAAAQWQHEGTRVDRVYTFGQPRTGDAAFGREYDLRLRSRSFRIVNHLDIVTRTPPRSVGYRHMGTLIYLDQVGAAHYGLAWWRDFLNGWYGAIENILDWCGEGVSDHRISGYQARLKTLAGPASRSLQPKTRSAPAKPLTLIRPRRRAA